MELVVSNSAANLHEKLGAASEALGFLLWGWPGKAVRVVVSVLVGVKAGQGDEGLVLLHLVQIKSVNTFAMASFAQHLVREQGGALQMKRMKRMKRMQRT